MEDVFPQTVDLIGVKDTVLHTWIVVAVLLILAFIVRNRFKTWEPDTWQLTIEWLVEYIENLVLDVGGRRLPEAIPYLTTMILFITVCNLLGLVPLLKAPTRDINTTVALSLVSMLSCQYYGIRKRGWVGWLRSFIEPVFIMLPMNLMGLFSRLLSMALRLFGNVVAGEIIGAVVFSLVPVLAPLPFNLLGMLTSVLQALVFTILTLVFIIDTMGAEEARSALAT